ncbi:hypothetical protein EXIGLDRAFT_198777 [Exidia glandulosa HHB12029]|uniref:Uncharacterized protein n=1 Tax=Exidia glandulosa HHB12029 TaxID=1314781 RepID=A0A165MXQ1_EXIGL|nr:hypothetical protein EXIGLDRAFT_198777 [Exidia glandulosa HHB12029]
MEPYEFRRRQGDSYRRWVSDVMRAVTLTVDATVDRQHFNLLSTSTQLTTFHR